MQTAYVHGLLIDYLIPKLYLSDIVVLMLLILWAGEIIAFKQYHHWEKALKRWYKNSLPNPVVWVVVLLLGVVVTRQLVTDKPLASLWYLLKLGEFIALGLFLWAHRFELKKNLMGLALGCTLVFQSALAIYHFHTQTSLFGYWFLGEPNLEILLGLAKTTWGGGEYVLPYGTTPHPNILGGIISVFIILLVALFVKTSRSSLTFSLKFNWQTGVSALSIALGVYALWLTQSWSAWLSLVVGLGIVGWQQIFRKKKHLHLSTNSTVLILGVALIVTPLLIHVGAQTQPQVLSLTRRNTLNQAALEIWRSFPLTGSGLNTFTTQLEKVSQSREVVHFTQPVHHLGLLVLSETGLVGIVLSGSLLAWLISKRNLRLNPLLLALVPVTVLDHYLLTTQTGLLIVTFTLFLLHRDRNLRIGH